MTRLIRTVALALAGAGLVAPAGVTVAQAGRPTVAIMYFNNNVFTKEARDYDGLSKGVADFLITYLPAGSSMLINAVAEEITVTMSTGVTRRADSLVQDSDGTPFEWPSIQNGYSHLLTLDLDVTESSAQAGADVATLPALDMTIVPRIV